MLYEPRIFWVLTCVVTVLTEACLLWFRYIIHMLFYFLINVFFIIQLLSSWVILSLYILDDSKSRWNLYRGWSANRFRAHRRVLDFSGNFLFYSSRCLSLNCFNTKTDKDDQQFFLPGIWGCSRYINFRQVHRKWFSSCCRCYNSRNCQLLARIYEYGKIEIESFLLDPSTFNYLFL